MIDLKTIDERLAKAKEDVAFWESARAVFLDPRISGDEAKPVSIGKPAEPRQIQVRLRPAFAHPRTYGELKRRVLEFVPDFGTQPMTTTEIAAAMITSGYSFASRSPTIAVNEALASLGDRVKVVGKQGLAKLWTKGQQGHDWQGSNRIEEVLMAQQQTPP